MRRPLVPMLIVLAAAALAAGLFGLWSGDADALVVYCAHDSVYAEQVLRDFERTTGIPVAIVFDTEATKSLGLVERLIREQDAPRCDVFWNNQLLGTLDLQQRGLLEPYRGDGFRRIPAAYKDPDGHWAGFGARFRVHIVNTERLEPTEDAVAAVLAGANLSRVAVAKPLYGTTLTHYSVLWHRWGGEALQAWHRDRLARGIVEATGNAHVKNLVAEGVCDLGLTDTDDFYVAKDEKKPVAMLPVRLKDGSTICMPNTVCIIKGTARAEKARELVDYLLSARCELALANSKARQVPLGPIDEAELSDEVRSLRPWCETGVALAGLGPARSECLAWLKSEVLR